MVGFHATSIAYQEAEKSMTGTWRNSDDGRVTGELAVPSNVTRLSRAIKPVSADGIPQVVYYHYGVAGRGNIVSRAVMGKETIASPLHAI